MTSFVIIDINILMRHHIGMRTTLNLDDDVLRLVRDYARRRSLPLGAAVGELVRTGLTTPKPTKIVNGFHVVDLPADSPVVTTEDVRRLEDDLP
jgi:hypothetical protein